MRDRELPRLKRHKKKLLGPFSHAFLTRPNFLTEVSWAETLFYESLWIGFLLDKRDFKFAIRCGEIIGSIAKNSSALDAKKESGCPLYFWSHMREVDFSTGILKQYCMNDDHVGIVYEMVSLQNAINLFPADRARVVEEMPRNKFFHKMCNKEHPFALQVMFIGFVIDICSGHMTVPGSMLRRMKPESLVDYPKNPDSLVTAGMLRAGVNAKAAYLKSKNHTIDTLPLWRAVSSISDCQ